MFSVQRCVAVLFGWAFALSGHAAPLTTNFSNFTGLGFAVGTSQTISQNGIRLQALQGLYEVTFFPEVNFKNFTGVSQLIQLDLAGANFDFLGFSIRDLTNGATLTSNRGGVDVFEDSYENYNYSGALWEDLEWVRISFFGSSAKFTSFTLDDRSTVANSVSEPGALALMAVALTMLGVARRRRV